VSTSTIVGLSVAGGVAALGVIAFFIWKFTRKRFSDLEDNEEIKWPELNAHNEPAGLSSARTGDTGFGAGAAGGDILRADSRAGTYEGSLAATSTTELYAAGAHQDPYAIPPLPQFNPNQPYRDDPNAFYDPYRGPVPETFDGSNAEAIPMTQFSGARARSPGPGAAYGAPPPGPGAAYGAPPPAVGGYGYPDGRSRSPGPAVYGDRARSPGPSALGAAPAYSYGGAP